MNILDRAQEWAADRFDFVQYPRIRSINRRHAKHGGKEPAGHPLLAALIGLMSLAVGAAGLFAAGLGLYGLFIIGRWIFV